ncbi:MAG: biopolymer transporter ExbD [Aulosira sp. DedQUE10]|nr:biopolymer transporter ExbD [Aulosira sp. DedQUE10]
MKVNLHTPVEEVQIQIIPLIDVVFCILTFFLLAALQFTRQEAITAINLDLPKANTGTSPTAALQGNSNILPVTIDAVGQTYVEKNMVRREQLADILKKYVQENPNGVLVLNASRTATYNDVIETLDLLRQVGGDRVSLGIIPAQSQTPNNSNLPAIPPVPTNPVPNTAPVPGINPQGNINPNFPITTPTQPQTGQDINPVPNSTAPNKTVAPGKTNSTPAR